MELLMPCHNFSRGVLKKKKLFEPKIARFCIEIFVSTDFEVKRFGVEGRYFFPPIPSF